MAAYQKSIVYRIGILYPSFLNSSLKSPEIPKHWELIPSDITFLQKQLQTYKTTLKSFQKEPLLEPIYQNIVERIQPLMDFLAFSLYDSSFDGVLVEGEEEEESEKKKHYFELSLFCIHLIWMIWMSLIDHPNIYRIITNRIRENTETRLEEKKIEEAEEEDDDMEEVNITTIQIENKALIQQKIADLFLAMMESLQTKKQVNAKEPAMMSYADIMREIDYSKDREKQKIKKYFTDMSVEERKAELVLKKLHLGIFAIDNKKLNKYGKNTGLFGDRDSAITQSEEEKAIIQGEEDSNDRIEESVEYQNMMQEENAEEDRDIFEEQEDEDLDVSFGERVEEEEDYEDINEYARENE